MAALSSLSAVAAASFLSLFPQGDIENHQLYLAQAERDPFEALLEGIIRGNSAEEILGDILTEQIAPERRNSGAVMTSPRPRPRPYDFRPSAEFSGRSLNTHYTDMLRYDLYVHPDVIAYSDRIGSGPSAIDGNNYYDLVLTSGQEVCGRNEHFATPEIAGATLVQPVPCNEQWSGPAWIDFSR